jgi:RNA polymerase sigma-32 factor
MVKLKKTKNISKRDGPSNAGKDNHHDDQLLPIVTTNHLNHLQKSVNTLPVSLDNDKKTSLIEAKQSTDSNVAVIANLPIISQGSLEEYISFVNSIPLLTVDEEYVLARQWRENEDADSARYLVMSHLRLVVSIARGYLGYGLPLADIIQEGTIGLMKAVQRFDERKNVRLVTFAIHWIRAEINEYVIKNWRIVKTVTTKNQRKLFFNLRSLRKDVGNLSEEEASQIAKDLDVSRDEVVDMNMRLTGNDVALLADNDDDSAPEHWLQDEYTTPEHLLHKKSLDLLHTDGIRDALEQLDERSRDIIKSRWLDDPEQQKTLIELAQEYKVSAERIRQIKAMKKMREILAQNYEDESLK